MGSQIYLSPSTVKMTVKETQPEIKGATAAGGGKPATMDTGLVVTVLYAQQLHS